MSSSPPPSDPIRNDNVPPGYVRLILVWEQKSPFYLEIPVEVISSLCLKPRKYLIFLGWCILGTAGWLTSCRGSEEIETDEALDDGGSYYYVTSDSEAADLTQAVDPEVIKQRTGVPSESTNTRERFCTTLLERDAYCVWTGVSRDSGASMHIIPYRRGSEWFRLIIDNRPNYDEDVTQLNDINDVRNGVYASSQIHTEFGPRRVVILKTPNYILNTTDIPPRHPRPIMPENVTYPATERYTLQWLKPDVFGFPAVPNNNDVAFKKHTKKPKPSDLLLHYNYGAAAVKWWGHGQQVLEDRSDVPRPPAPMPAPTGSQKTTHDRNITLQKLDVARGVDGVGAGNVTAGAGPGEMVDSQGKARWDEDDVMLFFWGNSKAATERYHKKQEESTQRMEQWRQGVPVT